jgi:hypothetical protein
MPTSRRRPLSRQAQRENAILRATIRAAPLAVVALVLTGFVCLVLGFGPVVAGVLSAAVMYAVWVPAGRRARSSDEASAPGDKLGHIRRELRQQLTVGERVFYYTWSTLILVLPIVAFALAAFGSGTVRAVGVILLFVTLIVYAVPISPILRRRIRRREARAK